MRVGVNPKKNKEYNELSGFHQVIIPVYIPSQEAYYKDSFKIFKYCLNSLFMTSYKNTYYTIINNGSCDEVVNYLNDLLANKIINELIHTVNIGKVNAVLKGISGHKFTLITIADADVIFLNNWQSKTYEVFNDFKKCGVVCTTPSSKSYMNKTANIYFDLFFFKKIKFERVRNKEALKSFAESVGNSNFYNSTHLSKILTVTNKKRSAVIGAGHFVATYRSDIFYSKINNYSEYLLGGNSVQEFLDEPVLRKGYWRLSTTDNYTYHMGNVFEDWMKKTLIGLKDNLKKNKQIDLGKELNQSLFMYYVKNVIFSKILQRKSIKFWMLKRMGLTKKEYLNY